MKLKNKNKDLISVVMATRDTDESYLRSAIESIINQSYSNIEFIIVVDGGSMEDIKIIETYKDERIKVIRHEKTLGLAASLNEAISVASGKYIARMDSDDVSLPWRLEKQYRYMERNSEVGVCSSFARLFPAENRVVYNVDIDNKTLRSELFFGNIFVHPSVMFRSSVLADDKNIYDKTFLYSQDYELWSRKKSEWTFGIVPRVLLLYRVHSGQISTEKKEEQTRFRHMVFQKNIMDLFGETTQERFDCLLSICGETKPKDIFIMNHFVDECVKMNKNNNVYDNNAFKTVIYRRFSAVVEKNGKNIIRYWKKILYFHNFFFVIKKVYRKVIICGENVRIFYYIGARDKRLHIRKK